MSKWNPYKIKVDDEWVSDFAIKEKISKFEARICLHIGLIWTNIQCFLAKKDLD